MKAWLQRFMAGRYGGDSFGNFLCGASLVCLALGLFVWDVFYYLGLAMLIYSYFRILSRNLHKRYAENQWYLGKRDAVLRMVNKYKLRFAQRKTYRYFRCPHCRQELRVPRGRGRISIHCPKCGTQFIKNS